MGHPDHEDPETESDVLYCFRIQRYIPDGKPGSGNMQDGRFISDIYNLCFLFGSWVFKRLRIHFADVRVSSVPTS